MPYTPKHRDEPYVRAAIQRFFRNIRKHKIAARGPFSCCQTCGHYEMRNYAKDRGANIYVFYHKQDNDALKRHGNLFLAHGYVDDNTDYMKTLQEVVVPMLERCGLDVNWDNTENQRIEVVAPSLKRRQVQTKQ